MFTDTSFIEIEQLMQTSWTAFHIYRKCPLKERANFLRAIAVELENCGDVLIETAMHETNLPEARLRSERGRTVLQLNQYADACEKGDWMEAKIDTAIPDKIPAKPDIRKMLIPLGPVVVFGASNFPFAYSTAGGDTATALAAGCPVIVKAHPAHAQTSEMVANVILKAVRKCKMPEGIFAHVHGINFDVGKALVMHKHTKAVGFTGSDSGGKQLFNWANQRKEPIPVFAEMGSVNPVFLLPQKLNESVSELAKMLAASIALGAGQFCTNPGLIIGIVSDALKLFTHDLGKAIQQMQAAPMLHNGIANAYKQNKANALLQKGVHLVAESETEITKNEGVPTIATVDADIFLSNPILHREVFGPYSLIVSCKDMNELTAVAKNLEGQLTSTLLATENDLQQNEELIDAIKNCCGRIILNNVPTGVEVCLSMHHGGPFPATTDARFTSVGADAIKRFARPICFQNWSNELLPDELKNENPLQLWRTINNQLTK